jgi:Na+/H+-translocating membrane pyrophosphatase
MTEVPAFGLYITKIGSLDKILSLLNPRLFAGVLIGSAFPPFFTGVVVLAVSNGANKLVDEIRRQFREIKGIMGGNAARILRLT